MAEPTATQTPAKPAIYHGQAAIDKFTELYPGETLTSGQRLLITKEGFSPDQYRDTKGLTTTGVGQRGEYADVTFPEAYQAKLERTKRLVPNFDTFPQQVQDELVASVYRGGLSGSPATLRLLNAGKYEAAAKEFLRNEEYKDAKKNTPAIARRMEEVANAIRSIDPSLRPPPPSTVLSERDNQVAEASIRRHRQIMEERQREREREQEQETNPIFSEVSADGSQAIAQYLGNPVEFLTGARSNNPVDIMQSGLAQAAMRARSASQGLREQPVQRFSFGGVADIKKRLAARAVASAASSMNPQFPSGYEFTDPAMYYANDIERTVPLGNPNQIPFYFNTSRPVTRVDVPQPQYTQATPSYTQTATVARPGIDMTRLREGIGALQQAGRNTQ